MKFRDYQSRALSTALPSAYNLDYLIPMIIGEVSELFGAQAKAVRDNWTPEKIAKETAKEYGDICWGVAVALHVLGVHNLEPEEIDPEHENGIADIANNALDLIFYPEQRATDLECIWHRLYAHALQVTAYSFHDVLEMNLAKLADRQSRGVIEGSGNDR